MIVLVYADWCGHCQKLKPIFAKVARKHQNRIKVRAINYDKNKQLCDMLGVNAFPTILKLSNGTKKEYNGARTEAALDRFFSTDR